MVTVFILWFVFTVTPGHLKHWPMDEQFDTQQECEEAAILLLPIVKEHYPDDPALRVYCRPFPDTEEKI